MDLEQVREMVREADYCCTDPPGYADTVLVSQVPSQGSFNVTCIHGDKHARYLVRQEVQITPVDSFAEVP